MGNKQLFLSHIGQTGPMPLMLDVDIASGVFVYDTNGKKYIDLNSGISVSSLGHSHPKIVNAICEQSKKHLHTMVYGEHIQSPQILFAKKLIRLLREDYESIYLLNSGSEAVELGIKLAKKYTRRYDIISCSNAYHGSTSGAEALRSDLKFKSAFMPLTPGQRNIEFNNCQDISKITEHTAGVIMEVVQGEAGVRLPNIDFLNKVKKKCRETGAILIFDEIQTGFGRTGHLFGFQKYGVFPDLILVGKAMGGGLPLSGVIGSKKILNSIVSNPNLGHITTFGGHPLSCASALAALSILIEDQLIDQVAYKENLFHRLLKHPIIKEVRSSGMLMAIELTKKKYLKHVVTKSFELGVLVDYFLFNNQSIRLAPPLIISEDEIEYGCNLLLKAMDYARSQYK